MSGAPPIVLTLVGTIFGDGECKPARSGVGPWLVCRPFDAAAATDDAVPGARACIDFGEVIDGEAVRYFVAETVEEIANLVDARRLG